MYEQPARKWVEALPVGNGRLGAMVFGGTEREVLSLNEDTLWSGYPLLYRQIDDALDDTIASKSRYFQMVQALDEVYACRIYAQALVTFTQLTKWLDRSRLVPMKKVSRTLRQHQENILNYFLDRITNAIAEGLNSLIQAAKRRARGYKTFRGYACMIYLVVGKLKLSCPHLFA